MLSFDIWGAYAKEVICYNFILILVAGLGMKPPSGKNIAIDNKG
jgi:hypothetical protein